MQRRIVAKYQEKKTLESGNTVYLYSKRQIALRNAEKAKRLEKLRGRLGSLRQQVKRDLKSEDPEKFLTALAVALIDETFERVGNDGSAEEGHYGVTGWLKSHVKFSHGKATIRYVGKSGVKQVKTVKNKTLVKALRDAYEACEDDCLFEHADGRVTATKVNAYLKKFKISAKDIRGYHANDRMKANLRAQRKGALPEDKKAREAKLKEEWQKALEETAKDVGHEPSTLASQYLVPGLKDGYLKDGQIPEKMTKKAALTPPPRPIQALVEWTQAMVAGWVWNNAEVYAEVLRDAGDAMADSLKQKEQLIRAAKKYAKQPVRRTDMDTTIHTVPFDLTGWRYPKPERLPKELAILLDMTGRYPFGSAQWISSGDGAEPPPASAGTVGIMKVNAGINKLMDIVTPQDLHRAMNRLETAIEHEGRHLAQDLLVWGTGAEQAGLGPGARGKRDPVVNPFEEPEEYHLSPQEFHPMVDSITREFRLKLKGVPATRQPRKIKELIDAEPMLKTLEARKPSWWRRAVREITRRLSAERVAARFRVRGAGQ